jgi:hypothetical protein
MQMQASLDGKPSTPTPIFPQGRCCTRCYAAKSDAKKCRCRCKGNHHGQAHKREADSCEKQAEAAFAKRFGKNGGEAVFLKTGGTTPK